ncbi:MAG: four helix bundle protein [Patescibacteria group bacterium]
MSAGKDFTDLRIWKKAHELTIRIYELTKKFPREEIYGLTSQLRRAAVSVESCIAESYGRFHINDVVHFLIDSRGSLYEV